MDITVIICTYNRAQSLAGAMERVVASSMPADVSWEILVVDNNSSDSTPDIVSEFSRRYPGRVRYCFERSPGKSYALNAGIQAAQGEILVFMDDDVSVVPTWLQNLTVNLRGGEWAGAGGRTLPMGGASVPSWLGLQGPYSLGGVLAAVFDYGDEPLELHHAPFGANMAIRREMFERYGGFRTDLGPSPNREIPRPNEDTEFGRRLMAKGERLRYEPLAVAYHPVTAERLNKKYFLDWWFDYGRAAIREVGKKADPLGIPRHWIAIPKLVCTLLIPSTVQWMFTADTQKRFYRKCWIQTVLGQIVEVRRQYRRPAAESNQGKAEETQPVTGRSTL